MDEPELGLTEVERKFLAGCDDQALTRWRMRQVVVMAVIFAVLLVVVTWLSRSWALALGVGLLYIAITTWEKVSFGRGVLVYKSIIRKLLQRLEERG